MTNLRSALTCRDSRPDLTDRPTPFIERDEACPIMKLNLGLVVALVFSVSLAAFQCWHIVLSRQRLYGSLRDLRGGHSPAHMRPAHVEAQDRITAVARREGFRWNASTTQSTRRNYREGHDNNVSTVVRGREVWWSEKVCAKAPRRRQQNSWIRWPSPI